MLNKTKSYIDEKLTKYSLLLCLALLIAPLNVIASTQSLNFYLPVHSSQFTENISQFQAALKQAGFDTIHVKTADFWPEYQQSIRKGHLGIYFAAPHFSSWAIHNHSFQPLLKLKEPLKYVIASEQDDKNIFETRDLIGKKICTQHALNLDYLLISRVFQKNLQSAQPHIVQSVFEEAQKKITHCDAFSISEHFFSTLEQQSPNRYIRLAQTPFINNYSFIIHPSVNKKYSADLTRFLRKKEVNNILSPILKLSSKDPSLVTASKQDYPKTLHHSLNKYWQ